MKLAISNIAWDIVEDHEISQLLLHHGVDSIDIAPGKYFHDPIKTKESDILKVRKWWYERGIGITGMQALLFGRQDLNMFSNADIQNAMLDYLSAICRIGACLGATKLVFGSPKNRDRSCLNDQQVMDTAISFFCRLGDIAKTYGVIVCLEPNPVQYGANFMTTSIETAGVVEYVGHPAIKMQLDTGAITINKENIDDILFGNGNLIGHCHASEPDLLPLGDGGADHEKFSNALSRYFPASHVLCIEMVATKNEPHVVSVDRALSCAARYYREDLDFSK